MSAAAIPQVVRPAGLVTRLLAAALDMLVVLLLLGAVFVGVAASGFLVSPLSFRWPTPPLTLSSLVGLLLAVGYLTVGWATSGRTCGAAVLYLGFGWSPTAVDGWGGRGLSCALLYVIFPVGLLWSAVSRERRSMQDVWSVPSSSMTAIRRCLSWPSDRPRPMTLPTGAPSVIASSPAVPPASPAPSVIEAGPRGGGLPRGLVNLLGAAATVAIFAGVQAVAWLIGPAFMALIVVIAVAPVQGWLRRPGWPSSTRSC